MSRRDLITRGGVAGAVVALQGLLPDTSSAAASATRPTAEADTVSAPHYFTAGQAATVDAVAERLIPADTNGPGARAALVWRYIDWLMTTSVNERHNSNNPTQTLQEAYTAGLAALDAYSTATQGAAFADLSPAAQDAVLAAMAAGKATGFTPNSKQFFNLIRGHTVEGFFGDPYYHGNAGFAGWKLIGFPGVQLTTPAKQHKLGVAVPHSHKSVVKYSFFHKDLKGMMR